MMSPSNQGGRSGRPFFSVFLALLIGGALVACDSGRADQAAKESQQREIERLRAENKDLENLRVQNHEVEKLKQETRDLHKLRGEYQKISRLRKENEQLKAQLAKLQQALDSQK